MMEKKKLNFGCGLIRPNGWINCDKVVADDVVFWDILNGPKFPEKTFDIIIVNHVLHMFTWDQLKYIVLPELHNILKVGGVLRVIDVDPITAFKNYVDGNKKALIIPDDVEKTIDGKFCQYLTWYGTRNSISTGKYMCELLMNAEFKTADVVQFKQTKSNHLFSTSLDTRQYESWFVEAVR